MTNTMHMIIKLYRYEIIDRNEFVRVWKIEQDKGLNHDTGK